MADDPVMPSAPGSREERLAAQLRANLRRRKAQARAIGDAGAEADAPPGLSKSGDGS